MDVGADYGSLILGGLFAFGLSGCINMQFIMYWQFCTEERWLSKSLVTATWFLDVCHSAFIAVVIWDSIISSYGNLERIDTIPWSVGPTVELTAIVTFLVQSFFAYRIYRLQSRKFIVAGPVFVLAFIRLVTASVSMGEMISLKYYSNFIHLFPSWVFTLGLSLCVFIDIVVTTFLCYFLRTNRTLIPSTNRIIDTLTLWTVQNGLITCLGAIASLICWLTMPQKRIFLGLYFFGGKLYANSLLATVNGRNRIRQTRKYLSDGAFGRETDRAATPGNSRFHASHPDSFPHQRINMMRTRSIEVSIQHIVEDKYDDEGEVDVLLPVMAESPRKAEHSPAGFGSVPGV